MSTEVVSDSILAIIILGFQVLLYFLLLFSPLLFLPFTIKLKRLLGKVMLSLLKCCGTKAQPEYDEGNENNGSKLADLD